MVDATSSGPMAPGEPEPVARLELGARAAWTGPAAFAVVAIVYVLTIAFEVTAGVSRGGSTLDSLFPGAGIPNFSAGEYLAHIEWRASVNLVIGASVAAVLVALHAVWGAVRRAPIQVAVISGSAVGVVVIYFILVKGSVPVAFMENVRGLVAAHGSSEVGTAASLAMLAKRGTETVAFLVGVGAASIVVLPETIDATDLARRVRALRLLLYTSAVLFVAVILMTTSTYTWFVSFFEPQSDEVRSALQSIISTGTLSAGVFYTLMLIAIYVPASAALEFVGRRLAEVAMTGDSPDEDSATWLERNGLSISWRGQLARVATLLAPLISSGLAQALTASV